MSSLIRWQQTWRQPASTPLYVDLEGWADSFQLGAVTLAATGHSSIAGNLTTFITKDIGSGVMATTGHLVTTVPGLDFLIPDVPSISGNLITTGRSTIAGNFDFEEPFFVDPPLMLNTTCHSGVSGNVGYYIEKSIGTGQLGVVGHTGFAPTTIGAFTGIVKSLFSVSTAAVGHTSITGDIASTTIKSIGSGLLQTYGRSTLSQTGFFVDAPPPYTHPIGSGLIPLIGATTVVGDVLSDTTPPFDIGQATMAMQAHQSISVERLFSGGILPLGSVSLTCRGRSTLHMSISYPGVEYPNTEAVAIYEGNEYQEFDAALESKQVSAS